MKNVLLIVLAIISQASFANFLEPCQAQARSFAEMTVKNAKGTLVTEPALVWFSETVSYGFSLKDFNKKMRTFRVLYSIVLRDENEDLSKPDACRLMIAGEISKDDNFIYSNY